MSKDHGRSLGHVSPLKELVGVWAALVVLTVVTVAVTWVDLGPLNLWVALMIAALKASLVAVFFMHLRYDRPISAIVFVSSLFFVALFVGFALMDSTQYAPETIPGYAPAMHETQPQAK